MSATAEETLTQRRDIRLYKAAFDCHDKRRELDDLRAELYILMRQYAHKVVRFTLRGTGGEFHNLRHGPPGAEGKFYGANTAQMPIGSKFTAFVKTFGLDDHDDRAYLIVCPLERQEVVVGHERGAVRPDCEYKVYLDEATIDSEGDD